MEGNEVVIIGAGAAGLIAARNLLRQRVRVTILEARNRLGGRIYTFTNSQFTLPAEGGAEFIHGKQKLTLELLKEYKIKHYVAKGKIWHAHSAVPEADRSIVTEHHGRLVKKLRELKRDLPLKTFLDRHFKGAQFELLRKEIRGFVEGYESASIEHFSTLAFKKDWLEAEEWEQYRIQGGYGDLINALADECRSLGCTIKLSSVVKRIVWKQGLAELHCRNDKKYTASKVLVTIPLGILQKNKIHFSPALPNKIKAARALGFGDVIKIQVLFKTNFWEEKEIQHRLGIKMKNIFFIFSTALVPTWWTQSPQSSGLLCGWLSGPGVKEYSKLTEKQILEESLLSLTEIFKMDRKAIRQKMISWKVFNWSNDEFTLGSYSYSTVNSEKNKRILGKVEKRTLYFAGEHFEEPSGTVEAAFKSGLEVAKDMLKEK